MKFSVRDLEEYRFEFEKLTQVEEAAVAAISAGREVPLLIKNVEKLLDEIWEKKRDIWKLHLAHTSFVIIDMLFTSQAHLVHLVIQMCRKAVAAKFAAGPIKIVCFGSPNLVRNDVLIYHSSFIKVFSYY
jgi:hypothetical protein